MLGVSAQHKSARRAYEKVGFRVEGHGRRELYVRGEYHDKVYMGLLRDELNCALLPASLRGASDGPPAQK
jgi:RimJ/RimL family protein N-acetyltransferase